VIGAGSPGFESGSINGAPGRRSAGVVGGRLTGRAAGEICGVGATGGDATLIGWACVTCGARFKYGDDPFGGESGIGGTGRCGDWEVGCAGRSSDPVVPGGTGRSGAVDCRRDATVGADGRCTSTSVTLSVVR